jgi:uncharacterized RDD family membrane protein YckC
MNEDPRSVPSLFDLPLEPPPAAARRATNPPARGESLPLFEADEIEAALHDTFDEPPVRAATERSSEPRPARPVPVPDPPAAPPLAGLGRRGRAALGDLVVLAAAGVVAAVGARALDAELSVAQLAPLGLFLVSFSFVYFVVPLAFWGGSPGMLWAGLVARNAVTEPLSFGQSVLRWLGTWLTWALAGLPGLLALGGRSLTDLVSGSATYEIASPTP